MMRDGFRVEPADVAVVISMNGAHLIGATINQLRNDLLHIVH